MLKIDEEPVVELDFSAAQPSIALAFVGETSNRGTDFYLLPGYEDVRPIVKLVVSRSFYSPKKHNSLFKILTEINSDNSLKEYRHLQFSDLEGILHSFITCYPNIEPYLYSGRGMEFQFLESELCSDILNECIKNDVPVIPIHDSFLVPESKEEFLRETMADCFRKRFKGEVKIKKEVA